MTQATDLKQVVEHRITQIIDQLQKDHPFLQDLDRTQQIREHTDELLELWQPQQILEIPQEELVSIVQDIMVMNSVAGMLNDLTPAQMQMFDEAVKRGN
ncbi:hypothetical protein Q2T42_28445 [Leptolyngbya boryana CZ1]|jgi:hypothetical protein|uniref:Uncharacterized protein n=2 Tax=Leptolyngbya boryana TaxID=1184 RepID=A0A1Z4JFV4_LEPBY|nr:MULTISPECIES: hypothetical protein [Leptolyngbya]BAY55387.1 hypothetical protein NIES2135_22100 [Leptolyngbya boryana NIES-2135]MBD2368459.1 hypothetical protein [Leptolyngbya sp. FACHB-161]MBD2374885.1 hypothetical protein [Leptolyngbya sp. FACHB-238]MBD2399305.1 hypothetical protein [Leptolyngbya sp. FACHB-239]MBD2405510.1 hypothetical protein [Leptolyngbya sp. FACHB-402]